MPRLGKKDNIVLGKSLDTWKGAAIGSSARVYECYYHNHDNKVERYAFKVMRSDVIDYATPLFREEAKILSLLTDVQGVMKVKEIGFILFDEGCELPSDETDSTALHMTGDLIQMDITEEPDFSEIFSEKINKGWLPYFILEIFPHKDNLYCQCDNTFHHYNPEKNQLNMENRVLALSQICEILSTAHKNNIVYRDHKIIHYYWRFYLEQVVVIDWNVGKYYEDMLPEEEIKKDLILFAVFTAFWVLSGINYPNAAQFLTSPDEIVHAAHSYKEDNKVLSDLDIVFREPIGKAMAGKYTDASKLGQDLMKALNIRNQKEKG